MRGVLLFGYMVGAGDFDRHYYGDVQGVLDGDCLGMADGGIVYADSEIAASSPAGTGSKIVPCGRRRVI